MITIKIRPFYDSSLYKVKKKRRQKKRRREGNRCHIENLINSVQLPTSLLSEEGILEYDLCV